MNQKIMLMIAVVLSFSSYANADTISEEQDEENIIRALNEFGEMAIGAVKSAKDSELDQEKDNVICVKIGMAVTPLKMLSLSKHYNSDADKSTALGKKLAGLEVLALLTVRLTSYCNYSIGNKVNSVDNSLVGNRGELSYTIKSLIDTLSAFDVE